MKAARDWTGSMLAVLHKDLLVEWRSREMVSAMLVFALLVIFLFNYALNLESQLQPDISAGVLWVAFLFAGTLGLNRSFAGEKDRGCLDGLLLAPVDHTAIYIAKVLSNLAVMLVTAAVLLPVFSLFYNVNLFHPAFLGVVGLGMFGYAVVGTLLAGLSAQARTRDILLPVLLFPVILPLVLAAVKASSGLLQGLPFSEVSTWFNLLLAYDLIFLAVALLVFEHVVDV
jgi:heme exporter protein B